MPGYLSWGYLPEQSREATGDSGRREGDFPHGVDVDAPSCRHRARRSRSLLKTFFDNPAPAWLRGEESFPEEEREAEFQQRWRDDNRAAVGPKS
jgi:hypothetical protein